MVEARLAGWAREWEGPLQHFAIFPKEPTENSNTLFSRITLPAFRQKVLNLLTCLFSP